MPFFTLFRSQPLTLNIVMIGQHYMSIELCMIFILAIQMWIPTMASKKSNFDELLVENQRTHMRQNYMVKGLNEDLPEFNNIEVAYATGSLAPHSDPEELPALIVDYANMIRDDIILLDNSIETRTRKRGNIKMKKFNRGGLKEAPCSCEESQVIVDSIRKLFVRSGSTKEALAFKKLFAKSFQGEVIYLGPQYVPSTIESRRCNKNLCSSNFGCQRRVYNITVLKKKEHLEEDSLDLLPDEIKKHWVTVKKPITIACFCTNDFRERY